MSRIRELLTRRLEGIAAQPTRPVVAVPLAHNPEVIGAIGETLAAGLADFILIGARTEIARAAEEVGVDVGSAEIIEETDGGRACAVAADLAASGSAQALMKGLVQTADFVRAILDKKRGLVSAGRLLSHVALCDVPGYNRVFLLTDAAVTTHPDALQKRLIVENAVACAEALGIDRPRVAMIAPVEKVSEKVPSTVHAAEVVDHFSKQQRFFIDGPFGLDVAIGPEAARIKGIEGPVAGRADILVLPTLDAANAVYKTLTGFAGAHIAGVVAGASVPVVLTSRADTEANKADSIRFALAVSGAAGR